MEMLRKSQLKIDFKSCHMTALFVCFYVVYINILQDLRYLLNDIWNEKIRCVSGFFQNVWQPLKQSAKIKKVHQQKSMHEKCTTLFVVTQILSHLDKHAKIEPAFLPKIKIKIHTYPK